MRKSRLSHYKQDRLIEHFVAGSTARGPIEQLYRGIGESCGDLKDDFENLKINYITTVPDEISIVDYVHFGQ